MVARARAVTWFNLFAALVVGAAVSAAQTPGLRAGPADLPGPLAQAGTPADGAGSTASARARLAQGRAELARGNFETAEALAQQAELTGALFTPNEDTPSALLQDV